jgi:trans-2,3-dihydro-3-hydroxyanthranilate isomerase
VPVNFIASDNGKEIPWFTAPPVRLGRAIERSRIASALNLSVDDIETKTPVQELDAGIVIICVPLVSLNALKRAHLELDKFSPLKEEGFSPFIHIFCPETLHPDNDLCARFFFDAHGVREDSATGSATACLGAYLLEYNYLSTLDFSIQIEQGYEIDRPSLLFLKAKENHGIREVYVGGSVIETMRGELL